MCFVYFFDLFDFDNEGKVCASKKADIMHARSNFLYLISKYNQNFLQEEKLPIPAFFKEELASVLNDVESGKDYEECKNKVFSACLPKVQILKSLSEREMIERLSEQVSVKDMAFADKFKEAANHLQLAYIITHISGNKFQGIWKQLSSEEPLQKADKSKLYKDIIIYNSLTNTAEKVKNSEGAVLREFIG